MRSFAPLRTTEGSETKLGETGMIRRPRTWGRPMELAICRRDRQVVDRGEAPAHQAALVEFPVLVAVGPEPVGRIVVPFVGEAHGDAVAVAGHSSLIRR